MSAPIEDRHREAAAAFMGMHLTGSGPDQRGGKVHLREAYIVTQNNLMMMFADAEATGFARGMERAAEIADARREQWRADWSAGPTPTLAIGPEARCREADAIGDAIRAAAQAPHA